MKFTYEKQDRSDNDVVAYIDEDGDLRFRNGGCREPVCLYSSGALIHGIGWKPELAAHKFYPGDKITLEF